MDGYRLAVDPREEDRTQGQPDQKIGSSVQLEEFLTTAEVAEELGVPCRTIRRMIERGEIEARPFWRDYFVREVHLESIRDLLRPPHAGLSSN